MIKFQKRKKEKRKEDTNRETKRDAPMRRMFLQGEDKKRGTILRHKFTRVYDTWSRNYISSLFLLFPLSTCLSIQPRIWCNFPATSVNCMHFRQRNHQIRCTPISCPLFANIFIRLSSLKKNKYIYIYSVYIFRQLYSRKACMKDSMPRAFFLLWKPCVFLRDIILIFNSWEYLLEFFLLFFFLYEFKN